MARYKLSLSVSNGRVSENHTRRVYSPESAEPTLADRNKHIIDKRKDDGSLVTYREQFNEFFAASIDEYNSKQKRKSRRKSHEYYDELLGNGKRKEEPVYSTVIQLGNQDTCGVTDTLFDDATWHRLKKENPTAASEYVAQHLTPQPQVSEAIAVLTEVGQAFGDWYPNLYVVAAVIHNDEASGCPHLTVDWVPWSDEYKTGLPKRCSQTAALKQMGFKGKGFAYPIKEWQADIKTKIETVMLQHDIEREVVGDTRAHEDVATYKVRMAREKEATILKELKRRQEVARMIEVQQRERVENLQDKAAEIQKEIKRYKKKATKAELRAEKMEDRAEQAEEHLEDAQREMQVLQETAAAMRVRATRAKKAAEKLEDEIEEKKREKNALEDKIHKLREEMQELTKKVHKLTTEVAKLMSIKDVLLNPLRQFKHWLLRKAGNGEITTENNAQCVGIIIDRALDSFGTEVGDDMRQAVMSSMRKYGEPKTPSAQRDITAIETGNTPATGGGKDITPIGGSYGYGR